MEQTVLKDPLKALINNLYINNIYFFYLNFFGKLLNQVVKVSN